MACDPADLSDKELRAALIALGESPGPITGTTRGVYEKWLVKLQKEAKGKRRKTLDTSHLRSTAQPKQQQDRRRSEQLPRVPQFRVNSISLSDLSDAEVPSLNPPPGSLLISTEIKTTKQEGRRSSGRINTKLDHQTSNNSLFSDDELMLDAQPVTRRRSNVARKSVPTIEPKVVRAVVKKGVSTSSVGKGIVAVLALLGILYSLYTMHTIESDPSVAEPCYNLSTKRDIPLAECDRIYNKIVRDKQEFDAYTGQVMCGQVEGEVYKELPADPIEQVLIFDLREDLNLTFYRKKEDLYFEIDSEIELETLEFNLRQLAPDSYFYKTNTPHRSWLCVLGQGINSLAYYIFTAVLILVGIELLRKLYQWKQSKAKRETGQMYELIDQIIEELQRNFSKYQTDPIHHVPYVPIPHARDRLLLPSERGHMKKIWERAVQFIAEHESRVRVEMRRVQSEDFPVWYWLEAAKPTVTREPADSTSHTGDTEFPFTETVHTDFLYPDLNLEPATESITS